MNHQNLKTNTPTIMVVVMVTELAMRMDMVAKSTKEIILSGLMSLVQRNIMTIVKGIMIIMEMAI